MGLLCSADMARAGRRLRAHRHLRACKAPPAAGGSELPPQTEGTQGTAAIGGLCSQLCFLGAAHVEVFINPGGRLSSVSPETPLSAAQLIKGRRGRGEAGWHQSCPQLPLTPAYRIKPWPEQDPLWKGCNRDANSTVLGSPLTGTKVMETFSTFEMQSLKSVLFACPAPLGLVIVARSLTALSCLVLGSGELTPY